VAFAVINGRTVSVMSVYRELRCGCARSALNVHIKCSEHEADDLLKVARQYCPGAVYAIEAALRLAGSSRRYHFVLCSEHHAFVHPY
jgi:hypothetical protein